MSSSLRGTGATLNAAYKEVSKRPGTPGRREVERIYLRLRDDLAVRAEVQWRRLRAAENADDTLPEIVAKEITHVQWKEYSALAAAECPNGMTIEDNLELWGFIRPSDLLAQNRRFIAVVSLRYPTYLTGQFRFPDEVL